jgi:hypothetical protein
VAKEDAGLSGSHRIPKPEKTGKSGAERVEQVAIEDILRLSEETKEAFDKLVVAGMPPRELGDQIGIIPFLPSRPAPLFRNRSARSTKDFSKQLETWAQQIEEANTNGALYSLHITAWVEEHHPKGPHDAHKESERKIAPLRTCRQSFVSMQESGELSLPRGKCAPINRED